MSSTEGSPPHSSLSSLLGKPSPSMELSISKCLSDDEDDIDIVEDNFDEPLPPAMRDSNGTVGILISPSSKFVRFSGFGNGEDYDDTEFERKGPEITRHDKFHSTICTILRHTSSEVVLRTLSDVGGWGNLFGSLVWVGQREGASGPSSLTAIAKVRSPLSSKHAIFPPSYKTAISTMMEENGISIVFHCVAGYSMTHTITLKKEGENVRLTDRLAVQRVRSQISWLSAAGQLFCCLCFCLGGMVKDGQPAIDRRMNEAVIADATEMLVKLEELTDKKKKDLFPMSSRQVHRSSDCLNEPLLMNC